MEKVGIPAPFFIWVVLCFVPASRRGPCRPRAPIFAVLDSLRRLFGNCLGAPFGSAGSPVSAKSPYAAVPQSGVRRERVLVGIRPL